MSLVGFIDPKSDQFCHGATVTSPLGNGRKLMHSSAHQIRSAYSEWRYNRPLLMIQVTILVNDHSRGHQGSPRPPTFLLITFNWKDIETRSSSRSICIATMHRLICNMTYLAHIWHWPAVFRFWPGTSRASCIIFNARWQEEHDGARIMPPAL